MIAREGIPFILLGLALTVVFIWFAVKWDSATLFTLSLLCSILTIWTVFFFRDPERSCEPRPGNLIAPADGKVVAIANVADHPFIGGSAVRISIFLSIFDVHINRIPATGTIDYVKHNPGRFLPAFVSKASELNENTEIGMTVSTGEKLVFKQIAGVIARRIVCRLGVGDSVTSGARFGMIRFGSRVDLIVPADSEISVKLGDHVTGGETIIGSLKAYKDQEKPAVSAGSESAD